MFRLSARPLDLELRRPFRISRGSRSRVQNLLVAIDADEIRGIGEGSPYPRYGESQAAALSRLASLKLVGRDIEELLAAAAVELSVGARASLAAIDIALHDWFARRAGVSLLQQWGLEPHPGMPTSFTVGLDAPRAMAQQAAAFAEQFRVLKIKLGSPADDAIIEAVAEAIGERCAVRVDANEGWSDREQALRKLHLLASSFARGCELVEQPLPAGRLDDMAWLKERSPLPLFADEESAGIDDMAALARGFHGVNIKLDKCGGLLEARRRIAAARRAGLSVMIGCMIASSLAITAAAFLTPLCDHADLDGHLLVADDPFDGLRVEDGLLVLPTGRPGLGVVGRQT